MTDPKPKITTNDIRDLYHASDDATFRSRLATLQHTAGDEIDDVNAIIVAGRDHPTPGWGFAEFRELLPTNRFGPIELSHEHYKRGVERLNLI